MKMKAISIKEILEERFTSEFGEIPKRKSDLKKYIQNVKESYCIAQTQNKAENSSLKQENQILKEQLEKSKSEREKDLENEISKLEKIIYRTRVSLSDAIDCSNGYFKEEY